MNGINSYSNKTATVIKTVWSGSGIDRQIDGLEQKIQKQTLLDMEMQHVRQLPCQLKNKKTNNRIKNLVQDLKGTSQKRMFRWQINT